MSRTDLELVEDALFHLSALRQHPPRSDDRQVVLGAQKVVKPVVRASATASWNAGL